MTALRCHARGFGDPLRVLAAYCRCKPRAWQRSSSRRAEAAAKGSVSRGRGAISGGGSIASAEKSAFARKSSRIRSACEYLPYRQQSQTEGEVEGPRFGRHSRLALTSHRLLFDSSQPSHPL